MKSNILLSPLCFGSLALAAPLSRDTLLIAGEAKWSGPAEAAVRLDAEKIQPAVIISTATSEESPSSILDSDRPLTTAELLALAAAAKSQDTATAQSSRPKPTKGGKTIISVGTLVVPGGRSVNILSKLFLPESSPYLIPGQYVARQPAGGLVLGLIVACALLVVLIERWALVVSFVKSTCRRERAIQLPDDDLNLEECDDEDSDDDSDAPFGGYTHRSQKKGLRLPERVEEKTACI